MNARLEHRAEQIKTMSIPGLDDDDKDTRQNTKDDNNMDIYFKERTEEEDGNDFFNDMVNTEDDPSVSEFLNTD